MITRKMACFECDFCNRKGQGRVEENADGGPIQIRMSLPLKWRGNVYGKHYCCELCEARFELDYAKEKIEALLKTEDTPP